MPNEDLGYRLCDSCGRTTTDTKWRDGPQEELCGVCWGALHPQDPQDGPPDDLERLDGPPEAPKDPGDADVPF